MRDYGNHSFRVKLPASMRCRGIHDVFHASLLRIHHPNDDRLFPGRLDEQIVEPEQHPVEWAADKIIGHADSLDHKLFQVLWKSGDRTWLMENQVEDLELLKPYLEAHGVTSVAELPIGNDVPPPHDPQIFLDSAPSKISTPSGIKGPPPGKLRPVIAVSCLSLPARITAFPTYLPSHLPYLQMGRSNKRPVGPAAKNLPKGTQAHSRPLHHYDTPNTIEFQPDTGTIILTDPGSRKPGLSISTAQFKAYRDWDANCHKDPYHADHNPMPAGYPDVARSFNSHPTHPCKLVEWDKERQGFFSPFYPIPPTAMRFGLVDARYKSFVEVGLLRSNGDVDQGRWKTVLSAIMRPHVQSERNRERGEEKRLQKELQRARQEDTLPSALRAPPKQ
ncbi:hypothetical protein C0989_002786 [Termitomyces sp. Mn162]|nr:hypothetical protein C0989_002786 [Termitomyces sp. Mn162]